MKRVAGVLGLLLLGAGAMAATEQQQAQREQRRADLRAAVLSQRQADQAAAKDRHLTPQERAELRQQLKRSGQRAPARPASGSP